nr:hypothetical protein BgiMline_030317 [Biomphalaria glabrata]
MAHFLNYFLVLLFLISTKYVSCDNENARSKFFTDIPTEMRCSGCLMTVKALTGMLLSSSSDDLEDRVKRAIDNVCEETRLSVSEYNPKIVSQVCQYLKKHHRPELTKELMRHFSHLSHSTHLPLAHHICQAALQICPGPAAPSHLHNDDEAWLHIDEKTQDLKIKPGKNMKMPRPVPESHRDEL